MSAQQNIRQNIFYRHFDLPANFPVIGLLGSLWQYDYSPVAADELRMHFHNCLEIGYLYEGAGQYFVDKEQVPFQAPCLVIAPPNTPHAFTVDEHSHCGWKWLYVNPLQLLPQLSPRTAGALSQFQYHLGGSDCIFSSKDYPNLFALTGMIIEEMENPRASYQHVVRELFYALFLMMLRVTPASSRDARLVGNRLGCLAPAITYIAENYMNDLSIEDLSMQCHISTSHFRRLFKQMLGWSPLDYLQMVRIERACALLYGDQYSVTDIGMKVGYSSPSSFSRQFRRIYGVSPSQWRQKMRSEENPIVTAYFNSLPPTTAQFFPVSFPTDGSGTKNRPSF